MVQRPKALDHVPPAATQDWPMGDRLPKTPLPEGVDEAKIRAAVDAAFSVPDAETTAFVVTYKGRLLGERYGDGITMTTPLESWSMGKSVTSTIMGTLIHKGVYTLEQPAPMRRYNDLQLAALQDIKANIDCECPNQVADLVMALNAFESYSAQCQSRNEKDAQMHRLLARVTGHARSAS